MGIFEIIVLIVYVLGVLSFLHDGLESSWEYPVHPATLWLGSLAWPLWVTIDGVMAGANFLAYVFLKVTGRL